MNTNHEVIITPLPDFKNSLEMIKYNNENLVIGIIGGISDIKGSVIVENIINYINKNNLNIKIIIFGNIIFHYEYKYKYSSIEEFNELLIEHKPNVLFETSLWVETYCYTLTMAMLTKLPILSLKKNMINVIENRLENYDKKYFFTNIIDFLEIANNVKQDYLYTIEPVIYFNSFWNYLFENKNTIKNTIKNKFVSEKIDVPISNKNVVLITSKIYVSNVGFSYVQNRSVYTVDQRFQQTVETINSIKKYIPNAYIVLFDNSVFKNNDYFSYLNNNVDKFINILDDYLLNFYTNEYSYKAFADIFQQLSFYNLFFKHTDMNNIQNFFKISGRYLINETFNFDNFNNDLNIFKKNNDVTDRDYYYTCFYKLNSSILSKYFDNLQILLDNKHLYENDVSDIEVIVPNTVIENISIIENLGITERIAVSNTINNI